MRAGVLAPAGDQERGDAAALRVPVERERRRDRLADLVGRLRLRGGTEREVVLVDRGVVREQRLVDVEDDRRLAVAAAVVARRPDELDAARAAPLELEVRVAVACAGAREPQPGDVVDLGDLLVVDARVVVGAQGVLPVAGVVGRGRAEIGQAAAAVPQLDHRRRAELGQDRAGNRDLLAGGLGRGRGGGGGEHRRRQE